MDTRCSKTEAMNTTDSAQDAHNIFSPGLALTGYKRSIRTDKLIVLGASGSVGSTALRFLSRRNDMELTGVSIHTSIDKLRKIIHEFPDIKFVALSCPESSEQNIKLLRSEYPGITFFAGEQGLIDLIDAGVASGVDTVLTAVVGAAGIRATVRAVEHGLKIALANKETLVTAGPYIRSLIRKQAVSGKRIPVIVPVDSEHNAVFQLLEGVTDSHIRRVILTASGGPFFDLEVKDLKNVKTEQVLTHPTWSMGPKITVDSAGMINKGLEMIEAHYLFSFPYDRLGVYIHRKSLVHAMIETNDGGYHMHVSSPDMIFPVAHSLLYPESQGEIHSEANSPDSWEPITFHSVDPLRFPGFALCMEAGRRGGIAPAVFNASNEVAVDLFLKERIGFTDIPEVIHLVLDEMEMKQGESLELFLESDREARILTEEKVRKMGH